MRSVSTERDNLDREDAQNNGPHTPCGLYVGILGHSLGHLGGPGRLANKALTSQGYMNYVRSIFFFMKGFMERFARAGFVMGYVWQRSPYIDIYVYTKE